MKDVRAGADVEGPSEPAPAGWKVGRCDGCSAWIPENEVIGGAHHRHTSDSGCEQCGPVIFAAPATQEAPSGPDLGYDAGFQQGFEDAKNVYRHRSPLTSPSAPAEPLDRGEEA